MISSALSVTGPNDGGDLARRLVAIRLNKLAPLDGSAVAFLSQLTGLQRHRAGAELIGERQPAPRARFIVRGWAARVRTLSDGRRQILGLVLPGDALGLCHRPHPLALATTIALTPLETLAAGQLQDAHPGQVPRTLADALAVSESVHEDYLLNQILRLGRLTAYERMCHLILELRDRLSLAGIAEDHRVPMPLTQDTLADVNGLSTVHINRVLQQLRREKMLDLRGGHVLLLDPAGLAAAGNYTPPETSRWL